VLYFLAQILRALSLLRSFACGILRTSVVTRCFLGSIVMLLYYSILSTPCSVIEKLKSVLFICIWIDPYAYTRSLPDMWFYILDVDVVVHSKVEAITTSDRI
jgi:hypothetical protein